MAYLPQLRNMPVTSKGTHINLATKWPRSVYLTERGHPDRRPEPITTWKFRNNFDFAKANAVTALSTEAGTHDGGNSRAGLGVRGRGASRGVGLEGRAALECVIASIEYLVRVRQGVRSQGRLDIQLPVAHK